MPITCLLYTSGVENINIDFGDLSLKPEIYEGLSEISGIAITSSFPHNWEVGAETVSKADGMKALCRHLGIPYSQTMAVGDQENDLAMVAFAGVSVAVENAADCVKAAACFIAPSNDQDGVGAAIERFVLNGWPEGSGRAAEVNEE